MESRKQESDQLVTLVREFLAANRQVIHSFFQEGKKRIDFLSSQAKLDKVGVAALFAELHTLKGGARTLGFVELKKLLHSAEDSLNLKKEAELDLDTLKEKLNAAVESFGRYLKIYDDLISDRYFSFNITAGYALSKTSSVDG
ncbi:MAG: Hpt domain-containing protein, partial [Oligoflexales bacterium]|nr:Hpt domain-containing protein [Oligoflexales bacterium]